MPTVLQQDGFSVMIYTRDHMPRHVHVFRAESEVVNIDTLEVRDIFGMASKTCEPLWKSLRNIRRFCKTNGFASSRLCNCFGCCKET